MIYKLMPRAQVALARRVDRRGGDRRCCSAIGKFLIGLYIGKSGVASGFGAAGSLVVVLVWVYYSAQIFLLGAEFTWVYARTFGSMRSLSESAKEDRDPDLPSAARRCRWRRRRPWRWPRGRSSPRRKAEPVWRNLGIGLATGVALRYIVPRLLRRR